MEFDDQGNFTGFLVTCNKGSDKRSVKEIYDLLNNYTEKVYGDIKLLKANL